jgi:hypothetical protein
MSARLTSDTVRELLRRLVSFSRPWESWCDDLAPAPLQANPSAMSQWQTWCSAEAERLRAAVASLIHPVHSVEIRPHATSEWLRIVTSPVDVASSDDWLRQEKVWSPTHWLRLTDKSTHEFAARVVPHDDAGTPAEPIELSISNLGGRGLVELVGFVALQLPAREDANVQPMAGARIAYPLELATPFVEFTTAATPHSFPGIGAEVTPWCWSTEFRTSICRRPVIALEGLLEDINGTGTRFLGGVRVSGWSDRWWGLKPGITAGIRIGRTGGRLEFGFSFDLL